MTQPTAPATGPPAAGEISALIAWARRLSDTGPRRADPADLAAFLHAKRDLLARIERCSPQPPRPSLTTSQETLVD